jgi:hypothetical protein
MPMSKLRTLSLYLLAIVILAVGFYGGFIDKNPVLIVSFLAFALLIVINNIDKLGHFSASIRGIELQTRIEEAEVKIDVLQKLVRNMFKNEISSIMWSNRWGGMPDDIQENLVNNSKYQMKELNLSEDDISYVIYDYYKLIKRDFVAHLLGESEHISGEFPQDIRTKWKNLKDRALDNPPSSDELKVFFTEIDKLTDERKEIIEDYRYFQNNGKHRRFNVWKNRKNWPSINRED